MSAAVATSPQPDRPSPSASLLSLLRRLIDYGKELAVTVRQRAADDPAYVRRCFGTLDVAWILASIARGLLRAAVLQARIVSTAARLDAPPRAAPPRPSRARRNVADPAGASLPPPTPEEIAARVRRQPIGAALADICRDLGIPLNHPLWSELRHEIIRHNGGFARLVNDIFDRTLPLPPPAALGLARLPRCLTRPPSLNRWCPLPPGAPQWPPTPLPPSLNDRPP
jgi:hypothetical protein